MSIKEIADKLRNHIQLTDEEIAWARKQEHSANCKVWRMKPGDRCSCYLEYVLQFVYENKP